MAVPTLTTQEIAGLLRQLADTTFIGRTCTLSAWVMLLYDHAIHLDMEIELFWTKPWGVAKCLYLLNRYTAPLFIGIHAMIFINPNVSDIVCLNWFRFEGYTGVTNIAIVELILGFRVIALWNRDKRIIAIVVFALLAEVAAMLTILSSTYMQMGATSTLFPTIPFKACVPFNIPSYFFAFWLPPLGYEFIVFVLAASKGYQTMRLVFNQFTFKTTGSRLIEVMIRDSLWYFLLIFVCDMVCSLIWLKGPDSLLQAVAGFGLVIPSVAGSHLLLNLRDAYYRPTTTFVTNNTTNRHQRMTTATIGGSNVSNQDQRDRDRDRDRRQAQSYDLTTFFAHSRDESGTGGGVDDAGFDTTLEGGETARSTMDMEEGTKMTPTTSTTGTAVQPSTPQKERVAKLGGTRKGEGYELNSLP